jgi:excinuclease ABC subunit B
MDFGLAAFAAPRNDVAASPDRATPRKPLHDDREPETSSRIFQPTSSREAALDRSTGGKPGHRGGWKKR